MRKLGLIAAVTKGNSEEEKFRKFIIQLKEETAARLVDTIYDNSAMDLKFWLAFGRKPFLGQRFNNL